MLANVLSRRVRVLYIASILKHVLFFILSPAQLIFLIKIYSLPFLILVLLVVLFVRFKVQLRASQIPCCQSYVTFVEKRMIVNLFPCNSAFWVVNQTSLDKIRCLIRQINVIELWDCRFDFFENFPIIHSSVRKAVVKHLIKNDSKGPDVRTPAILLALMDFGRHGLVGA